jgi:hypothetical protein
VSPSVFHGSGTTIIEASLFDQNTATGGRGNNNLLLIPSVLFRFIWRVAFIDNSPGQLLISRVMFKLVSAYEPAGDQPRAIAKQAVGVRSGAKHRTVLGVTGSTKGLASRTSF